MSLKALLGISSGSMSDCEIYAMIGEAIRKNLEDIEITDPEGNVVRIHIPSLHFDPQLMNGINSW